MSSQPIKGNIAQQFVSHLDALAPVKRGEYSLRGLTPDGEAVYRVLKLSIKTVEHFTKSIGEESQGGIFAGWLGPAPLYGGRSMSKDRRERLHKLVTDIHSMLQTLIPLIEIKARNTYHLAREIDSFVSPLRSALESAEAFSAADLTAYSRFNGQALLERLVIVTSQEFGLLITKPVADSFEKRLQFDETTSSIYLDGNSYHHIDPKAFALYRRLVEQKGQPITRQQLRTTGPNCRQFMGDKTIPNAIAKLPTPLKETVFSGAAGYWIQLPVKQEVRT